MLAIVPVKGLDGAKSRLAAVFSPEARADLVRAMLTNVLAACAASQAIERVLLVTPEPELAPDGVDVLVDGGTGHGDAVAGALADPRTREGAIVVMADVPLVHPDSLDRLASAAAPVALAPARDGGMNAFAFRGQLAFEPAFGVPDAAAVTVERARAVGVEATVVDDPLLALDFDRPGDITALVS
ncbi:MAG: 2-phospho-L-lactate guanylyltransferase [Gaiellaceae bacterium]